MNSFIKIISILFIFTCCESPKKEDSKSIAEEHNNAKFNDIDKKKDAQLIVDAAGFYLEQICLLKLAQQNSINPKTQITAKTLEKEYTKLYALIKDLGNKKQITIPTEGSIRKKKICKALSYEIAEEFDEKFFLLVVKDHRDAIEDTQKAVAILKDPDLKSFLKNTIPQLKRNLAYILMNADIKRKRTI